MTVEGVGERGVLMFWLRGDGSGNERERDGGGDDGDEDGLPRGGRRGNETDEYRDGGSIFCDDDDSNGIYQVHAGKQLETVYSIVRIDARQPRPTGAICVSALFVYDVCKQNVAAFSAYE